MHTDIRVSKKSELKKINIARHEYVYIKLY